MLYGSPVLSWTTYIITIKAYLDAKAGLSFHKSLASDGSLSCTTYTASVWGYYTPERVYQPLVTYR